MSVCLVPTLPSSYLAAAVAGALATACSAAVAPSPNPPRATVVPSIKVAPITHSTEDPIVESAPVTDAAAGPRILIERVHDPKRLATGSAAGVSATVERAIERAGFTAAPRDQGSAPAATFLVSPTVRAVKVTPEGRRTKITCSITLRISPWSAADQTERWEPHVTAAATADARATTSNARAQIALAITDCLENAVYAAASREVIPFLRRIDSGQ